MKKIIALITLATALTSNAALAKTEGNSIGLDIHRSVLKSRNHTMETPTAQEASALTDSNTGLGVTYKHAVNLGNNFFVAPGAFYERLGNRNYGVSDTAGGVTSTSYFHVQNRYGVRADLGYDVNQNFAVYATVGLANTGYTVYLADGHGSEGPRQNNKTKTAMLYGIGLTSKINDKFSVGTEYNHQSFEVNNRDQQSNIHTKTNIDLYKLTLSYNF